MSMFRLGGKRSLGLKDSPSKLSSLNSVVSLSKLQSPSPAKRLRMSNGIQSFLSSTLNNDLRHDDRKDSEDIEASRICRGESVNTDLAEKTTVPLENPTTGSVEETNIVSTAETPPPTPEIRLESRLDSLRQIKEKLITENENLQEKLDQLVVRIIDNQNLLADKEEFQLVYENLSSILAKGHNDIRDQLNLIYNPGQVLGQQAECLNKELREKEERKFEKMSMDLNNRMDQALLAIRQRKESLAHEIELHERTLVHKNNEQSAVDEREALPCNQKLEQSVELPSNVTEDDEKDDERDDEDCVIVVERGLNSIRADDDAMSAELSKSTDTAQNNCDDDDDKTDVDEASTEGSPFTPCQAQRPEA